ncbi:MAG TPA: hypothetical protein VK457_22585 [Chloroflexota bacterium]|nr:hypothetical protein [Chloroflexota bacterium]
MKLPLETISGTIWAGVIITALLALLTNVIPSGYNIAMLVVLLIWAGMFGLLVKPTPPKT